MLDDIPQAVWWVVAVLGLASIVCIGGPCTLAVIGQTANPPKVQGVEGE